MPPCAASPQDYCHQQHSFGTYDHCQLLLHVGHGQSDQNRAIQGAYEAHCRSPHDVNAGVAHHDVAVIAVLPRSLCNGACFQVLHAPRTTHWWQVSTCISQHTNTYTQVLVEYL